MFDLRHLEHSTIIYEDPQHHPLLRLAWNKQDPNYLATFAMDAVEVMFTFSRRNASNLSEKRMLLIFQNYFCAKILVLQNLVKDSIIFKGKKRG